MNRRPLRLAIAVAVSAACGDDDHTAVPPDSGVPDAAVLDPSTLEKFVKPMPAPLRIDAFAPGGTSLTIGMYEIHQQLHPDLPPTRVWAYGQTADTASYPGPTIMAQTDVPIDIRWENHLPASHFLPVDPTIHWANPVMWPGHGVPTTVHVHGGLQESASDGHPDSWFTADFAQKGSAWVKDVYHYENANDAEPLWYHDHALGITRLNVYAGLAGFYLLRNPQQEALLNLPSGAYERELLFQDRSFNADGSLFYPTVGDNPAVHPNWNPEFFGDVNLVNGVVWPYLQVEPRKYRFLLLNGANARFYQFRFTDGRSFVQVGTDGGYLKAPVSADRLLLAPGERADVVVDFSDLAPGATLELVNDAKAPFPGGDPVDENTGKVMQLQVVPLTAPDTSTVPASLVAIPALGAPVATRTHTLVEVLDDAENSLGVFLDGRHWGEPGAPDSVTETPVVGTTELWELANTTMDAHPIHLHLIDIQIVDRQDFDAEAYERAFAQLNPTIPAHTTTIPPIAPYLKGTPVAPAPNELGWKDTILVPPKKVTRFLVRWGPERGTAFPFDATAPPGYVWHCHILEHEDNEMMRRVQLQQ